MTRPLDSIKAARLSRCAQKAAEASERLVGAGSADAARFTLQIEEARRAQRAIAAAVAGGATQGQAVAGLDWQQYRYLNTIRQATNAATAAGQATNWIADHNRFVGIDEALFEVRRAIRAAETPEAIAAAVATFMAAIA